MTDPELTVVVVDDEKLIREGCARVLSKADYRVYTAENGREGLDLIIRRHADIALLDLKMPVMDGMAVLDEIRERQLDTVVIVITGHGTIETAVQSMKRGAYDFITKPFAPDQVRMVVRRAWEMKCLEREAAFLREERAKSLRDIATEKSRISNIIQAMADGVIITDQNAEIVLNNAAASRLLGLSPTVLRGRSITEVVCNAAMTRAISQILNAGARNVSTITQELEVSDDALVRATSGVVRDEEGTPMGTVTVLQDIGHVKRLERMKSDFVSMVVHELRSPLAAMRQHVDLLRSQVMGPLNPTQRGTLDRVAERSTGLLRMINNLLDLSKIEAGKLVLNKERLDMKPVITAVVELIRPQAEEQNIRVELELPDSLPPVLGDPMYLEGVVMNLVSNAVRYNRNGGSVHVQAGSKGDMFLLEVSDTGIGIAKEDLPRIFDRFYRVHSRETRKVVGTGLGLPIVKGVVDAHLGSIEVESVPERGTIFRVFIPAVPAVS